MNIPQKPYGATVSLVRGDALDPQNSDILAAVALLDVGQPIPDGWVVLTGNNAVSQVARIGFREDVAAEIEP